MSAPIYHLAGEDLVIFKHATTLRLAGSGCDQTLSVSGGLTLTGNGTAMNPWYSQDRWTITAPPAETYTLTLRSGDETTVRTLEVLAAFDPAGPILKVCLIGDSLTVGTGSTGDAWRDEIKNYFGDRILLVGSQGIAPKQHEGYSGQYWTWHELFGPLSDVDNFETAIADNPDVYLFLLGVNDVTVGENAGPPAETPQERSDASLVVSAENIITEVMGRTATPAPIVAIATTTAGNGLESASWNVDKDSYRTYQHLLSEDAAARFDDRTGAGIHVFPLHCYADPIAGYPSNDFAHPNDTGYSQSGIAIKAMLTKLLADAA